MPIHVIDADFGSYAPRRNRPVTIGRDETLGLLVRWRDGPEPVNITGGYATAWLVDAEGAELGLPARIVSAADGTVEIVQPAFTLAAGRYTLVTRLTLGDVTRRARVDLTLERAIGTLVSPPVALGSIADVSLAGGAAPGTIDAAAVIVGATDFEVTGTGASVDAVGIVTLATGAVIAGETVEVTGSNDAGSVSLSFTFTVTPSAPAVVTPGRIEIEDLGTTVRATFAEPELSGVPAPGAVLAATIDGGVLAVTDGEAIIPKALAVQALAAVWAVTNTAGEFETDPVTASVPAYEVPDAMAAPVPDVLSATAIRFPRPAAPENGGNAITEYRFYYTVGGIAQAPMLDVGATVDVTDREPGDVVAGEFRAVNGAGESDPGATATATTWELPDQMAALVVTGGVASLTIAATAPANLNGRPLNTDPPGYRYEIYNDADELIGTVDRPDTSEHTVAPVIPGPGVYATVRARTDAGSGVASPASNAVTVLTGASATLEEIDSIAEVAYFDGGIAQGLDATDIPVSLASTDADDGAVIEARYVEFSDWNAATPDVRGTEGTWQAIGTVSGGTISGATLNDVPLDLGTYKRIECRVQGSAAPESIMTRKVCVGLVVVGLGQSNAVKFAVADNSVTITPETIPEPNNVQLWTPDRTNTPRVGPTIKQINNEAGNEPMPGFARMVRLIQVNYPGLKILFGLMAVSGVQAPEWVDPDGTPPRPWEDDRRFVQDEITRHGTKIGVVWNMSWTAFMNQNAAIMVPILTQKLIDGTPVSLGTTIGEGGLAYTLNHSMAELVDYSYTKIGVIISTGRPAQSPTFTHTTVGEIMTTEAALAENIPGGWDPFFENTTDFPMALPKQWSPQTMCLRLAADDPHFSNDDDWGFPLLGELYAYQMLDMLGIVSVPTPEITDTDWTETHIDLWNPAYDITTRRNEEGGTSAFVRGFVFDGVAMTTEAQLLPNAGGSGRVGIRIAPSGGVDGSEPLFYGIGGIPGLLSSPADITARYIGDLPIMDLGLTGVPGMPIVARGQVSFESNLVGTPFFTLASGHGGFEDPASGGSGLDKVLTVEAVIRRTQSTDTGTFAQVLSNNFSWRMERSGILELGGGSQPNLPNVNFSDVFTFGKFVRVIISVDLNAGADGGTGGIIRAWHGEPGKVMTALTPTPVPSPGSISSTQPLRLLTPSLLADVRYINAWKQAITTDTVPDATTAYKRLYAGEGGTILTPSLPVWGSESVAS